jgi:GGDEF domain-containing protein
VEAPVDLGTFPEPDGRVDHVTLAVGSGLELLDLGQQLGDGLEQVGDEAVVRDLEDGRVGILVDGDDDLGAGQPDESLVSALVDPETSLFNYAFLNYKLDEEFKRARRFESALSCVMLGFEGQLAPNALQELASIFLELSRDTDVLGRFDECSVLFLLPHTGPDGAKVRAKRIGEQATERSIVDLVGDPVVISVGISTSPHPDVRRKDDLFSQARRAFLDAQKKGGGVVCTT